MQSRNRIQRVESSSLIETRARWLETGCKSLVRLSVVIKFSISIDRFQLPTLEYSRCATKMNNQSYENMTGEAAFDILMSHCDAEEEEFIKSHLLSNAQTTAKKNSIAGPPSSNKSATEYSNATSGKEIDTVVENLCDILRLLAENTRATLNELRKDIALIESIINNKGFSYTCSEVDIGKKKAKTTMKLLVEEYEAMRGEVEKEFILSGIYLFYILPKQFQIMEGLKKVVKIYSTSFSGTHGSSLQPISGTRKNEDVEYTTKVKEADVPTIGGYPGRAILSPSQRKEQAENLLRADMRRDTQLFIAKNIIRLLDKGPVSLERSGFEDGINGSEMELGDANEKIDIRESNGNGDAMVDCQAPDDVVDSELEEECSDDEDPEEGYGARYDDFEDTEDRDKNAFDGEEVDGDKEIQGTSSFGTSEHAPNSQGTIQCSSRQCIKI